MPDDDLVVANEDFLHEKAQHASAFDCIERADGRAQAVEEARHGFGETQTNFPFVRLVFDRLQQQASLFAAAQIWHATAQLFK
ncbi:hypothetical protein [Bradyrhizobium sp. 76]|uniref:hypothetical protein n=1 Tax=Bradyrhizobium sp. 76 TaxID=2782680 RepID=UPI001FFB8A40|nr:hypothetical protein [Bradyrhizobium sp. 76]MCK1406113.1 hypothetical protein [Bradyrhizobium sp. 76]